MWWVSRPLEDEPAEEEKPVELTEEEKSQWSAAHRWQVASLCRLENHES